jgi:hypothetical protein
VELLNNLDLQGCGGMFDVLYGVTTTMQATNFYTYATFLLFCIGIAITNRNYADT